MGAWLAEYAWVLGAVVVGVVLLHSVVGLVSTARRVAHERSRHQRELELFAARVRVAQLEVERKEKEKETGVWNGIRKFEVQKKVLEGGDICSFHLVPHDGKPLPGFKPGQYLTFSLNVPDRDRPLVRCYSLSDAPRADSYRVSIKRVPPPRDRPDLPPGLSSNFFHDHVNEGDILDVKAPGGHFFLDMERDAPVVLIGGGVGITPVLSMLNAIVEHSERRGSKRETWFFYGVRFGTEHVMRRHLDQIAALHDNVHLHVCYSDATSDDVLGRDYHHKERVSVDLFKRVLPSNNYDFYMCGPPPMMKSLTEDLSAWGVPKERVHLEAFGPASVMKPKAKTDEGEQKPDQVAIEVAFTRSGKKLSWDASFDSLLEFAEANGISMDSGCRAGGCGTCLTAIKSGEVEYLSEPDAEPEEGSCLTCVCVPKGPLELDA